MQKLLRLFAAVVLTVSLQGCMPQADTTLRDARMVSNTAVLVVESAQSAAELLYAAQQNAALDQAAQAPGATKESVKAAVEVVRLRWVPVRTMFDEARAQHQNLVRALDAGENAVEVVKLLDALWKKHKEISNQLELLRGAT